MIYKIWHWAFNPKHDIHCNEQYEPFPFEVNGKNLDDALRVAWCGMSASGEILNHCPKDHFNTFEYFKKEAKIEEIK